MSVLLEKICIDTYTVIDIHRRISFLQECLEEVLYHGGHGSDLDSRSAAFISYAKKSGSQSDVSLFEKLIHEIWDAFDGHDVGEEINKLKEEVDSLPSMTVYVPVAFDEAALALIGVWCKKNVTAQLMLDIQIDPAVVGGCAFVYNDTYHDMSFRELMRHHTGLVTELLHSYA